MTAELTKTRQFQGVSLRSHQHWCHYVHINSTLLPFTSIQEKDVVLSCFSKSNCTEPTAESDIPSLSVSAPCLIDSRCHLPHKTGLMQFHGTKMLSQSSETTLCKLKINLYSTLHAPLPLFKNDVSAYEILKRL